MGPLILFDGREREALLPFTFTRPVADLRIGIHTLAEKWAKDTNTKVSFLPPPYLREKFKTEATDDNLLINGSFFPDRELFMLLSETATGTIIKKGDSVIAARLNKTDLEHFSACRSFNASEIQYSGELSKIDHPWDIFRLNGREIEADLERISPPEADKSTYSQNFITGKSGFYLEEGANCRHAFIDLSSGPVYLGKNVTIQEGAMIKGPFAACDNAVVKMGAKIYGPTTIGPWCKTGGEINNVVFWGYSNKAHDGFLGNAAIGQWCNIGADTNNSNLKNNYEPVKVWDYQKEGFTQTGLQFCGLFMGDHTKCGINTMFNTGTVTGVSANIFGGGFPRTFIPSFSWGGASGFKTFRQDKAFEAATRMMERRNIPFDQTEQKILEHIFQQTQKYRS